MLAIVLAAALASRVSSHHPHHAHRADHSQTKRLHGIVIVHADGSNVRPSELGPKNGPVWKALVRIHATCADKRYTTSPSGNLWCLVYQFKHNRTLQDDGLILRDYQ